MKLKKLRNQQKNAIGIVHNETKCEHTKEHFRPANVLNLYKLNLLNIAVFMRRVHTKTSPVFTGSSQRISHLYSRRSLILKFSKTRLKLTKTKYRI